MIKTPTPNKNYMNHQFSHPNSVYLHSTEHLVSTRWRWSRGQSCWRATAVWAWTRSAIQITILRWITISPTVSPREICRPISSSIKCSSPIIPSPCAPCSGAAFCTHVRVRFEWQIQRAWRQKGIFRFNKDFKLKKQASKVYTRSTLMTGITTGNERSTPKEWWNPLWRSYLKSRSKQCAWLKESRIHPFHGGILATMMCLLWRLAVAESIKMSNLTS